MHRANRRTEIARLILIAVVSAFVFLPEGVVFRGMLAGHIETVAGFIGCLLLAVISLSVPPREGVYRIVRSDIWVCIYAVYVLINAVFIRPYPVTDIFYVKFFSLLSVYLAVRTMKNKDRNAVLGVGLLYGFIEAVLVLSQTAGLVASNHRQFAGTGTFFNPALTGGFLAISLCIGVYFLSRSRGHWQQYLHGVGTLIFCYALFLTDSRAGWLAGAVGAGYVLWVSDLKQLACVKTVFKNIPVLKIVPVAFFIGAVFLLYSYKKESADGRLFIWKNCVEMLKDKPLTGHGTGMFQTNYLHYQADFFRRNPDSEAAMVAGNPIRPFNEYLSVLTEQGIVGLFLLSGILIVHFSGNRANRRQKGILLAWLVFAFFSYPTENLRLMILPVVLVGMSAGKGIFQIKRKMLFRIIWSLGVGAGLFYGVRTVEKYGKLQHRFEKSEILPDEEYQGIKNDPALLRSYFSSLPNDISVRKSALKDLVELYPSVNRMNELGRMYRESGETEKAEECFDFVAHINPSLITANYELFLLHIQTGDTTRLRNIGNRILIQPVKKEGTISIKAKAHVKRVLGANDCTIDPFT